MEDKIFEARIRLLLRQWPVVWGGNLIVQGLCCLFLWPYFPHEAIFFWWMANFGLFTLRLVMRQNFEKCIESGPDCVRRWARDYAWSALIGGFIWGSGAWMFFDAAHPQETLFLLVVMIGVCAAGLPALSSYSPAFGAFSTGMIVPMSAQLWLMDWMHAEPLALLALIFLGINLSYSRNLDRTITASITSDLDKHALLKEVTLARDKAENMNFSKSRFLAAVSHDLRQPLHAMGLFIDSLGTHLTSEVQHSLFSNIRITRRTLNDMFESLLEISRLESGAVKPIYTHFRLRPLIEDAVNSFLPQVNKKGLSFDTFDFDDIVHTDAVLLSGILRNLLSNAIKYTPSGGIWIKAKTMDHSVCLEIGDSGIGIPKNMHQLIYDEYQQINNPTRDRDLGLGIGLSIVKKTCHLLHIQLGLNSELGHGSVFSLELPIGNPSKIAALPPDPSQDQNFSNRSIVVIDDDEMIRSATIELLISWGCTVISGRSHCDILPVLGKTDKRPDLLISDYWLDDGYTGIDMITKIRKNTCPDLPALLISGDTDPKLRSYIRDQGYYLLSKPLSAAQLRNIMHKLLKEK